MFVCSARDKSDEHPRWHHAGLTCQLWFILHLKSLQNLNRQSFVRGGRACGRGEARKRSCVEMPLSRALALTLSIKASFALKVEGKKKSLCGWALKSVFLKSREWLVLRLLIMGKGKTNAEFFFKTLIGKKGIFTLKSTKMALCKAFKMVVSNAVI